MRIPLKTRNSRELKKTSASSPECHSEIKVNALGSSVSTRSRHRSHPEARRIRHTASSTALRISPRLCGCARKLREASSMALVSNVQRAYLANCGGNTCSLAQSAATSRAIHGRSWLNRRVVKEATLTALAAVLMVGASISRASAQEPPPDTTALAKRTQNPVGDLVSLPFQFNFK